MQPRPSRQGSGRYRPYPEWFPHGERENSDSPYFFLFFRNLQRGQEFVAGKHVGASTGFPALQTMHGLDRLRLRKESLCYKSQDQNGAPRAEPVVPSSRPIVGRHPASRFIHGQRPWSSRMRDNIGVRMVRPNNRDLVLGFGGRGNAALRRKPLKGRQESFRHPALPPSVILDSVLPSCNPELAAPLSP